MPEQAKEPEGWGHPVGSRRWHFWELGGRWSACRQYTRVDLGHRVLVVAPPADERCRVCVTAQGSAAVTLERAHELVGGLAASS
jgi:hypothetical protein